MLQKKPKPVAYCKSFKVQENSDEEVYLYFLFSSHSPRNYRCTRRLWLGDLSYVHWPSTRGEVFVNSGVIVM